MDDHHLMPRFRTERQVAEQRGKSATRKTRKRASGRRYKLGEGRCRLCQRPDTVRPLTRHHLVPVTLGGTWRNENIVPLCNVCHVGVDAQGTWNRHERLLWRSMLRRVLTEGEVSHIRRVMGDQWLTWNYPDIRERAQTELEWSFQRSNLPRGVLLRPAYRRELGRMLADQRRAW